VTEPEPATLAPEDTGSPAPRRSFSALVTIVCSIVVAIYIAMPVGPLIQGSASPLAQLEHPEDSLERLVTRELDLREAMRHGLHWEWRVYRMLSGDEDPIREARAWYEELSETVHSPSAELHLTILRAESGEVDRAEEAIRQWKSWGESGQRMGGWVSAAYLDPPPGVEAARVLIADIRDEREPDWFTDTLTARIATRVGDTATRSQAQTAILARGRALQLRLRLLMALVAGLLVLGVLALMRVLTQRSPLRVADAPIPPDWSSGDGYALFVRALGAPQAIILVIFFLLRRDTPFETPLGMAADLLIFWWVARYLRSRQLSIHATFGLSPPRKTWRQLAGVTFILITLALVSDSLIDAAGGLLGLKSHWADGFSEDILWHPRWTFVLDCINVTVWAPVVEELTFRGLLYATLRTRLAVWPSAILSAALFALPHGYAAAGSLSVLVSGVLWAWAYERTRSLVPGFLAHSANNLMSTLWVVGLLRM
jgi:membrane protease YdiL (CAAX protease family)